MKLRFTSYQGNFISLHHSLYNVRFTPNILLSMILIPIFFNLVQLCLMDQIMDFWAQIFDFCIEKLHLDGDVLWSKSKIIFHKELIAYPSMPARLRQNSIAQWRTLVR